MATPIIMPKQGQSVESCILFTLYKKKGDTVQKGDLLFSYETDKASFEETAPADGQVLEVFFGEGDEIPVLQTVMVIGQMGEAFDAAIAPEVKEDLAPEAAAPAATAPTAELPLDATNTGTATASVAESFPLQAAPASPRAKTLAHKHGINLRRIQGSGPNGRILEADVQQALTQSAPLTHAARQTARDMESSLPLTGNGIGGMITAEDLKQHNLHLQRQAQAAEAVAEDYELRPITHMRRLIARAMHSSLQNSAQLTHHLSADARRIMEHRKRIKKYVAEGFSTDITLNDMICYAVIRALKQFPEVNAHFLGDKIKYFNKVHLALAVDTDRGLMVPVVKNACDMTLPELARELKNVAKSCKGGNINPDLLSAEAAGFTVSNLGNYGVEMFTPVINLPQVAILGVNAIIPRPKELGGGVYGFVPHMGLSLTYDHRALDGGHATRFVKQIANEIENLELSI